MELKERIIDISSLTFSFNDKDYIFKDASLFIEKGDFAFILGENGCGKTTLLRLILNLIKDKTMSIKINTKKISYLPQSSNFNKGFPMTCYEFLYYNSKELRKDFNHALKLIDKYSLKDHLNSLIGDVSGGTLQKFMLIRSLLTLPELLIVDEPTNNLDTKSKKDIYETLYNLNKENNITILVVEHDTNLSNLYGNKIFMVSEGKINRV